MTNTISIQYVTEIKISEIKMLKSVNTTYIRNFSFKDENGNEVTVKAFTNDDDSSKLTLKCEI
jgi:hypothetical protein